MESNRDRSGEQVSVAELKRLLAAAVELHAAGGEVERLRPVAESARRPSRAASA
jgi:hypothetical protein